ARSGSQMIEFTASQATIDDYDRLADAFSEDGHFRVTILGIDGSVLGDSRLSAQEILLMENQSQRPEILEAANSGIGISKRFSDTLNIDLLLVAARYNSYGRKGYFRVALPLNDLAKERLHQRILFSSFLLIALIIAAGCSLMASRYLLSLVNKGKALLEKRVVERTKQIETLQNIMTQLTACNSMKEILEVIKLGASIILPNHAGALFLFRSSKDKLEICMSWNGKWQGDESYTPKQCRALRTGQPYDGNLAIGNIPCDHLGFEKKCILCVPVVSQGITHGVFHFSSHQDDVWKPEERQLACAIAEHVSLTLANFNLRESLRQQAIRDPLTGLYNRRYMLETMTHEISRVSRRKQHLGLLMLDIDHFKQFNDDHGHDIGDFILSEFGALLKKYIREEDIACRYGGEEFTILLPETNQEGVFNVAEKIRNKIREHDFRFKNNSYGPITVSIGGALYPGNATAIDPLLKEADNALYQAKHTGRDRVVICAVT
ncbi:MAG: sensor domain-containing diguanylate cyclase, partial [Proteobacteria bacterium]|nr:sensor domain-containing diguanylate cyclase [Pseudomonadota bacterium]